MNISGLKITEHEKSKRIINIQIENEICNILKDSTWPILGEELHPTLPECPALDAQGRSGPLKRLR